MRKLLTVLLAVILAFLIFLSILSYLPAYTPPLTINNPSLPSIPEVQAQSTWLLEKRGYNYELYHDSINPNLKRWTNAPEWVWNGSNYQPYIYKANHVGTDGLCYLMRNGYITVEIYPYYAKYFDVNYTEVRLFMEQWEVQRWQTTGGGKWQSVIMPSASQLPIRTDVSTNSSGIFLIQVYHDSWGGDLNVTYVLREASPLKHEVVYKSPFTVSTDFRLIQRWSGIVGNKCKNDKGDYTITGATLVNSTWFQFSSSSKPFMIFEDQWQMCYYYNGTDWLPRLSQRLVEPVTIDVHAQGMKANFIFATWTLVNGQSLTVDPSTYTFQTTGAADNFLRQDYPTYNYGASVAIYVQSYNTGSLNWRSILKFDTSSQIPSGATINSAILSLYYYNYLGNNPSGRTYWAYRVTSTDWVEGTENGLAQTGSSCWSHRQYSTLAWTTAGGDYTTDAGASTTIPSSYGWVSWTVTAQVQYAVNNVGQVAHFLVKDGTESSSTAYGSDYYSKEYTTAASRPKLYVDYTVPITITLATTPLTSCNVRLDSGSWVSAPHDFTGITPSSSHSIEAQDPYVVTANQEQYVWASWSDSGANPHNVAPATSTTYTATMTHQWYFLVSSAYDSPTGTGWYNAGSSCGGSTVTRPVSGGTGIRYETTGWTGTGSLTSGGTYGSSSTGSFTINAYSTCTWNWLTQYQPTITLGGTSSGDTVSITARTLNGASNTPSGLYTSWNDWCDAATTLTFSTTSTSGKQIRSTTPYSWTVNSAFSATPIWDRMKVNAYTVSSSRVNLNVNVDINATVVYEYDSTAVTTGTLTINGYSATHQGNGIYKITRTSSSPTSVTYNTVAGSESTYGLNTVNQNSQTGTVVWDRLIVSYKGVDDARRNVDQAGEVRFKIRSEGDGTFVSSGSVSINGTAASWDAANSWWELTASAQSSPVIKYYVVTAVSWNGINLNSGVATNATSIIWDRFIINYKASSNYNPALFVSTEIRFKLRSEYDNAFIVSGSVTINSTSAAYDASNGWWKITDTYGTEGTRYYIVTAINEGSYAITALNSGVASNSTYATWTGGVAPSLTLTVTPASTVVNTPTEFTIAVIPVNVNATVTYSGAGLSGTIYVQASKTLTLTPTSVANLLWVASCTGYTQGSAMVTVSSFTIPVTNPTPTYAVRPTILDADTRQPIQGAKVTVGTQTVLTDAAGVADLGTRTSGLNYLITVEAEGYQQKQETIALNEDYTQTIYLAKVAVAPTPTVSPIAVFYEKPIETVGSILGVICSGAYLFYKWREHSGGA